MTTNVAGDDPLRHWSALVATNPKFAKMFTAPGGFRGTAISPVWRYMRLTEHFGPHGVGWGSEKPEYTSFVEGGKTTIFCLVECWYVDAETGQRASIWGLGGHYLVQQRATGTYVDSDAYKSAYTDAVTNAFLRVGCGADVSMGLFDDVKYLTEVREAFSNTVQERSNNKPVNSLPIPAVESAKP